MKKNRNLVLQAKIILEELKDFESHLININEDTDEETTLDILNATLACNLILKGIFS